MANDKTQQNPEEENKQQEQPQQEQAESQAADEEQQIADADKLDPVAQKEEELSEMKDKYLRLYSEFENFRRRTAKERQDLLKTANQDLMQALLPVLDDLERARQSMEKSEDVQALKEGLDLVFNKFQNTLQNKGLTPMKSIGEPFDADLHEAITQIPAPSPELKGKVVDEVEKGYYLQDKVIRFAKVVTGA